MNSKDGYLVKRNAVPVKRYCQTLDLKANPQLITEYRKWHSRDFLWPEISEGIRLVGILEMEIYILGTRLFMIVETPLHFGWNSIMARLVKQPYQAEWEDFVGKFQSFLPNTKSDEKWQMMERMFRLYE